MPKPITKAVIAAAGYGTRFLPATKNQPKEMLPLVDKPIIHYLVEEAVNSGIKDIILITRHGSGIMEDYFDNHYELEDILEKAGKTDRLEMVRNIPQMANFIYVRQKKHLPYGNGTPLLAVKELVDDNESFVYMFGDDLTISEVPVTKQLIDIYQEQQADALLAVQEVPREEIERYASIEYKTNANYEYEMLAGYEKLPANQALSTMAMFGRFVLSYAAIEEAQNTNTGKDNELWMIDILNNMVKKGGRVIAPPIEGMWLTTGDPLRYLKATMEVALRRPELAKDLQEYLKGFCTVQIT